MKLEIATILLAAFVAAACPGCDEVSRAAHEEAAKASTKEREPGPEVPTKEEVFRKPAPRGAGDDPRVSDAGSAGDAVGDSLAVIHRRLRELKTTYDAKARTEG